YPENQQNSSAALNRLTEISNQLSLLNERLRNELLDSRQNSRELQNMLELSKQELDGLRQELERLRIVSAELSNRAENSLTESTELLTALKRAESSLVSLEQSFAAYRLAVEQRIQRLERENKLWKWGCIAAGVLATGLGTLLLIGR
ncbi:MAG: hypothetical protein LBI14_11740, partial [Treponema sp.]|nr:hypothetical protein [Treponema sp.]